MILDVKRIFSYAHAVNLRYKVLHLLKSNLFIAGKKFLTLTSQVVPT